MARAAYWLAAVWTVLVDAALLLGVAYQDGAPPVDAAASPLPAFFGRELYVIIVVTLLLAMAPLFVRRSPSGSRLALGCGIALLCLSLLGAASVGLLFAPAAVLILASSAGTGTGEPRIGRAAAHR